jgi:chromosome partitioning protein
VGKTTVALGLAAALARAGAAVLAVDLDPQASTTRLLGIDVDERHTIAT